MDISDFLTAGRVVPKLGAPNRRHVLRELARIAGEAVSLDPEAIHSALLMHEDSVTIGMGRGSAVPHAMVDGVTETVGVFARLKPAIDFGAPDGIPADLVFMILAPVGDDRSMLRAMSCVARRLRVPDLAARIRSAADADAIYAILASDAWMGESAADERIQSSQVAVG